MTNASAPVARPVAAPSATDAVFETILEDIVRGTYAPGARLPAERDLARKLGASRPTLREALRRLAEWQLVESRRGSGVVVRDKRDWSIEALPAYLKFGSPTPDEPSIPRLLVDLLSLRRALIREIVRIVAGRLAPGTLENARAACARAWDVRHTPEFPREDFEVTRSICEAARFMPAVWMLNRVAGVYFDIAGAMSGHIRPPDDYLETHERFFAALESADAERAASLIDDYFTRHDKALLGGLEAMA